VLSRCGSFEPEHLNVRVFQTDSPRYNQTPRTALSKGLLHPKPSLNLLAIKASQVQFLHQEIKNECTKAPNYPRQC